MPARRDAYGRTLEDALTEDAAWRAARSAATQRRIDRATRVLSLAPYVPVLGPLTGLVLLAAHLLAFWLHRTWGLPAPPLPFETVEQFFDLLLVGGGAAGILGSITARLLRDRWAADARIESLDVEVPPLPGATQEPDTEHGQGPR